MDFLNKDLLKDMEKYEVGGMRTHELPIVWDKAENYTVYGKQGNSWLDFTSGIFVANVGHNAPLVKDAIKKQTDKLIHSYIFPNEPRIELEKELCKITGMDKALLLVTGSEANDAVIQMMQRRRKGRILTLKGAYYGSTIGCRSLTDTIDEGVLPTSPHEITGIFLQIFRGKDAKLVPHSWLEAWYKFAKDNDIIFGIDEMQSGMGRTGKWFGYQHYNIEPDFITIGKALGGGLPISAVVGRKDLLELSDDLWSTHTGNPVCCASALATIKTIKEKRLVKKTNDRNAWIEHLFHITYADYHVYGQGLMWGINVGDAEKVQIVLKKCAEKGLLLVNTHGTVIKIAPPLTISDNALILGIRILKLCLEELRTEPCICPQQG